MSKTFDSLNGKVAIVTGGSRGIGRAIVRELARNKVKVVFSYLQSEALAKELVSEVSQLGSTAHSVKADVGNLSQVKTLLEEARSKFGEVDLLVNNAGILRDKTLMLMSDSDWSDVVKTNLDSVFFLTRSLITSFLKRRSGAIVNISSTAGLIGNSGQSNYSATKAGIIGFTKALAKEVALYGVRVNAVAPGFIDTDMTKQIPSKKLDEMLKFVPMNRLGKTEEVAKVVSFLLSDESSYITGQVIPIDGGLAI